MREKKKGSSQFGNWDGKKGEELVWELWEVRDQTSSWFENCGKNREKSVWELGQEKGGTDDLGIVGKIGFQIFWNHRGKFHVPNSSSVFHFPLLPSPCPPYPSLPYFFRNCLDFLIFPFFPAKSFPAFFFFFHLPRFSRLSFRR